MSEVVELFGVPTDNLTADWEKIISDQLCPFTQKICFKGRKSEPEIKIGTCTVRNGKKQEQVIICPSRLLDRNQIFVDCLSLLRKHRPGNEYHLIPEFSVPGGSVDFVLASVKDECVVDFVGIELQTLDTTGTVWPQRQAFLSKVISNQVDNAPRRFGINWKMTAKTILMQMHHKAATFNSVGCNLVLVIQDPLLNYMRKEFSLDHFASPSLSADTIHFHSYRLDQQDKPGVALQKLKLSEMISTDLAGMEKCLGLKKNAVITKDDIVNRLSERISENTLLSIIGTQP